MSVIDRIKRRYGVSGWGVVAILLAFSLAGMTVVRLKNPILDLVLSEDTATWLRWVTYVLIIMPLYQVCLLFWGTVLGQFNFFWGKLRGLGRLLAGVATRNSG